MVSALDGVDLVVPSGEYLAVVGPSGAGKSSLLNILGCLDQPSSGSLEIGGRLVSDLPEKKVASIRNTEIGFVFQSFNLIPSLTALANVELPMVYAGVGRIERQNRAQAALGQVGLRGRERHRSNQLSGGQQQRVAVARAIVNRPTFILADEPTGNLDSHATEDVLTIFDELHGGGATVIVITHEDEVAARAQRVIVMRDGRIERSYRNEKVTS
ncbi:ABC transporter ATP-binding protein [Agreia sp. PsM10]|uniref:ABC transporter ATP-binding protein n=1 Tax=Agreia sp. PsM10 TaxID=3030533 RepID=UPI00263BCE92|nr:ABC transporter ATP-binding protein [Agreia sp. PsM10]MDN4639920.1 ABC transporter ATP-binding protein [Agreia sp. PsM10]